MLNKFKKVTLFVLSMGLVNSSIAATSNDLCLAEGYTVGFFNGVWNTVAQAGDGLAALRVLNGTSYNGEPIQYENFYNTTGTSVGQTSLQDLAETFEQRALEIDNSGELGKRMDIFWDVISGDKTLTEKLSAAVPSYAALFDAMYSSINTKVVAGWSYLLSNPPTEENYAQHNTRLDALAVQRQKLLLVAHSQGNLFMNHGFDFIKPKIGATSVAAVHIAPASPTLRGDYILADIDLVINGLRVQGVNSVPASNIVLPLSIDDVSGHTLVGTYLDPNRAARATVAQLLAFAIKTLNSPSSTGTTGAFNITLTWDGAGDVDLHVTEPSPSFAHVFYANDTGIAGVLDYDNTTSFGPEHYYASCDSTKLVEGVYKVGINNYVRATGRIATVQAASAHGGILLTKTLGVGVERGQFGDNSPIPVMEITVQKNAATGRYSFSAK